MSASKRAFDVVCAILGMIVLLPVCVLLALLIFLEDRRHPLFSQERIGRDGKPFRILKFRSMYHGAERAGPQISVSGDSRITRVGHLLRATKLDELPQLLNVLRGEMSLVGPRPEVRGYVDVYTAEQSAVLHLCPGITDPASIRYRDEATVLANFTDPYRAYVEVIMPDKIRINLWYAARATMWTDIKVILATLGLARMDAAELGPPVQDYLNCRLPC